MEVKKQNRHFAQLAGGGERKIMISFEHTVVRARGRRSAKGHS